MGWKRCSCEGNRSEAADILRSLIDRIESRPTHQGKLEIDLYGDLAGIPTLARKKAKPLDQAILSVQQSPTEEIGDRSYRTRYDGEDICRLHERDEYPLQRRTG